MPQSQHFTQPHGRWAPTPAQLSVLHMSYALDKFPSMSSRTDLANRLGVSPRQVQIWHQNMRQKERKSAKALQPPGGVAAPASSDINVLAAVVPPSPASYESSDEVGGEPPPEARQKRPRGEATQAAAGGSGGGGGWAEGSPVLPCSPSGLELAVGRAMQHALAQMKRQATAAACAHLQGAGASFAEVTAASSAGSATGAARRTAVGVGAHAAHAERRLDGSPRRPLLLLRLEVRMRGMAAETERQPHAGNRIPAEPAAARLRPPPTPLLARPAPPPAMMRALLPRLVVAHLIFATPRAPPARSMRCLSHV
eukprot:CAMPEP_0185286722 /NCGR_PEP_ID=MMETSP1363-20130426/2416_1 /TAXON_ID=38817 /ORGANISM="Gephyrocapsa oceanica, Strain RCC1303" /LENGTH=310 /DNA_ID=CAMNT_0027882533 /DNA_START=134 /DNA_END=1066 /DNA_ORIENTATION=+